MDNNLFNIKFYLAEADSLDQDALIPLFHGWIRDGLIANDVMIDVADYRHVPQGPGVMLVCHEAHYGMSEGEGRLGLLYSRKRGESEGDLSECLSEAFGRTLFLCDAIEKADALGASLSFEGNEVLFQVGSRREWTNTDEAFEALKGPLQAFFEGLYGEAGCSLTREGDSRDCLTVRVESSTPVDIATLLGRIAA